MKPSLMWPSARPNSAVNIQAVCPRLGVQDAMARPWSTSIKSHNPPAGRYVHRLHIIPRCPIANTKTRTNLTNGEALAMELANTTLHTRRDGCPGYLLLPESHHPFARRSRRKWRL